MYKCGEKKLALKPPGSPCNHKQCVRRGLHKKSQATGELLPMVAGGATPTDRAPDGWNGLRVPRTDEDVLTNWVPAALNSALASIAAARETLASRSRSNEAARVIPCGQTVVFGRIGPSPQSPP